MTFDITTVTAPRLAAARAKLTPAQEKFLGDARSYMILRAPFWAHYLYNEMELWPITPGAVPSIAATDSHKIFVDVETMMAGGMNIKHCAFVLAHEVCHGFLDDLLISVKWRADEQVEVEPGVFLPYDPKLMNMAMDYRINAMLVTAKIGDMPTGMFQGLYDPNISREGMESCVEIYKKLYQQSGGRGGQGSQPGDDGSGQGHGGFDVHLEPGQKQVEALGSGKRVQAIAAAVEAHKAGGQGELPGALQRLVGELLDPKVPWQDHLRATMQRAAGDPSYDWRYLEKRLMVRNPPMYFARQSHLGCGTIVVAGDTSGSITDSMLRAFMSEIGGIINDLNPARVVVLWCDADVHNVHDMDDPTDIQDLLDLVERDPIQGGGGTRFEPVFDWVADELGEEPDMLVYLTDLYGSFPQQEPDYPVIWGSISGATPPWGEVVDVEIS